MVEREGIAIMAVLAGMLAGVVLAWLCWRIFGEDDPATEGGGTRYKGKGLREWDGGGERECGGRIVRIEPEVTQEDVRSFFAKYDPVERNVPVAMIAEWKQMAAEKMAAVKSAEDFAFEQGRLRAYGEMERAFLEVGKGGSAEAQPSQDADQDEEERS